MPKHGRALAVESLLAGGGILSRWLRLEMQVTSVMNPTHREAQPGFTEEFRQRVRGNDRIK